MAASACGRPFEARRFRGEHLRMTRNLLRGLVKKNFAIPYPRPLNRPYHRCRPVHEGALLEAILKVGRSESWPSGATLMVDAAPAAAFRKRRPGGPWVTVRAQ